MKQLVIEYPDNVSEAALVDFITKSCHYYHYRLPMHQQEDHPDLDFYDELLDVITRFSFSNDKMNDVNNVHQQWQLDKKEPWKSNNEPEWD